MCASSQAEFFQQRYESMRAAGQKAVTLRRIFRLHAKRCASLNACPYSTGIVAVVMDDTNYGLLTKWKERGSLQDYSLSVSNGQQEPLSMKQIYRIAADVAQGMDYLHNMEEVHGNLKPANIFLGDRGGAALSSSDLRFFYRSDDPSDELYDVPTDMDDSQLPYCAPETLIKQEFLPESDVYSFGMTLLQVVNMKHPLESATKAEVLENMKSGNVHVLKVLKKCKAPRALVLLLRYCIALKRVQRPSFQTILQFLVANKEQIETESDEVTALHLLDPRYAQKTNEELLGESAQEQKSPTEQPISPSSQKELSVTKKEQGKSATESLPTESSQQQPQHSEPNPGTNLQNPPTPKYFLGNDRPYSAPNPHLMREVITPTAKTVDDLQIEEVHEHEHGPFDPRLQNLPKLLDKPNRRRSHHDEATEWSDDIIDMRKQSMNHDDTQSGVQPEENQSVIANHTALAPPTMRPAPILVHTEPTVDSSSFEDASVSLHNQPSTSLRPGVEQTYFEPEPAQTYSNEPIPSTSPRISIARSLPHLSEEADTPSRYRPFPLPEDTGRPLTAAISAVDLSFTVLGRSTLGMSQVTVHEQSTNDEALDQSKTAESSIQGTNHSTAYLPSFHSTSGQPQNAEPLQSQEKTIFQPVVPDLTGVITDQDTATPRVRSISTEFMDELPVTPSKCAPADRAFTKTSQFKQGDLGLAKLGTMEEEELAEYLSFPIGRTYTLYGHIRRSPDKNGYQFFAECGNESQPFNRLCLSASVQHRIAPFSLSVSSIVDGNVVRGYLKSNLMRNHFKYYDVESPDKVSMDIRYFSTCPRKIKVTLSVCKGRPAIHLINKMPVYVSGVYTLDFSQRVTERSLRNVQLCADGNGS
eukprot:TRINITY_DN1651_c0_g1_i15.p1 TRINITY_DN1651_c0_g1~~TRINITY_DN1651_c0_g1_i15.p1  ORF type:complete len:868 (-),score=152.01 TRINITY_DN1651_c0_g1_i15:532-3135(-)